ncbi:DUF7840 domain-containing protein, partial [Klebsiella pneumoniae]
ALATADASTAFAGGWRAGPGTALGLNLRSGRYRLLAEGSYRHDLRHGRDSRTLSLGQSLRLQSAWDARLEWLLATDVPNHSS